MLKADEAAYCSCFCEENAFKLAEQMIARDSSSRPVVVFVSSLCKATPLWHQRAAEEGDCVCWDYHVFVALDGHVYDLDSTLPFPTRVEDYIEKAFRPRQDFAQKHKQLFRVLPGREFLSSFSSDRSHMSESGKPFPAWPCIRGAHAQTAHDLPRFLDTQGMLNLADLQMAICSAAETVTTTHET